MRKKVFSAAIGCRVSAILFGLLIIVNDRRSTVIPSVLRTIGNTPVVPLAKIVPPDSAQVLVKLEYLNPTGSYKDRMALAMI